MNCDEKSLMGLYENCQEDQDCSRQMFIEQGGNEGKLKESKSRSRSKSSLNRVL